MEQHIYSSELWRITPVRLVATSLKIADKANSHQSRGHTARWRPQRADARELHDLHRAAIRMAEARAGALTDLQAAHGLEQQFLALIECVSEGAEEETATDHRHRDILARFEDLLVAEPSLRTVDICAAPYLPLASASEAYETAIRAGLGLSQLLRCARACCP